MHANDFLRKFFSHTKEFYDLMKVANETHASRRLRPSTVVELPPDVIENYFTYVKNGDMESGLQLKFPQHVEILVEYARTGNTELIEPIYSWMEKVWAWLPDHKSIHKLRGWGALTDLLGESYDEPRGPVYIRDLTEEEIAKFPEKVRPYMKRGNGTIMGGCVRDLLADRPWRDIDVVFTNDDMKPGTFHAEPAEKGSMYQEIHVPCRQAYLESFDSERNQVFIGENPDTGKPCIYGVGNTNKTSGYAWNITAPTGPADYLHRAALMASRGLVADRVDLDMALYAASYILPGGWNVCPPSVTRGVTSESTEDNVHEVKLDLKPGRTVTLGGERFRIAAIDELAPTLGLASFVEMKQEAMK